MLSIRKWFIYTLFLKMLGRSSNKQKIQFIITSCILGGHKGTFTATTIFSFFVPYLYFLYRTVRLAVPENSEAVYWLCWTLLPTKRWLSINIPARRKMQTEKKVKKLNRKNKLNTKIFGNKGPRAGGGNPLRGQLDSWSPPGRMLCWHLRLPHCDWWLGWKGGSAETATRDAAPYHRMEISSL